MCPSVLSSTFDLYSFSPTIHIVPLLPPSIFLLWSSCISLCAGLADFTLAEQPFVLLVCCMTKGLLSGRNGRGWHGSSKNSSFMLLLTSSARKLKVRGPGWTEHWQVITSVFFCSATVTGWAVEALGKHNVFMKLFSCCMTVSVLWVFKLIKNQKGKGKKKFMQTP